MNATGTDDEISSAIMEVALSLDEPAARDAFLDRVFKDRPGEKEEMIRLLDTADDAAAFFLEAREQRARVTAHILSERADTVTGFKARPVEDLGIPEQLGPYRLVTRLGEGGGGVVYEAEQEQPIRRRVAVKFVRVDVENKAALARFDIERQTLALMDHPNIAKVFDAGTTPLGKPYFVMELVTGESIVRYCDQHKLTVIQRLELFILVCQAVQHAHQKGIIHRDLKPTNVIVVRREEENIPKIIDFGIAKVAGRRSNQGEPITCHDQFFGTPAYMSPEQVAMTGLDVDTRSDLYSLGILLYELLTGATPVDGTQAEEMTLSKIRKTLLTREIQRPSETIAEMSPAALGQLAAAHGMEPGALLGFVRGDLDWIVMKAVERSRSRRYQTANDLATDIRRLLAHQPILARPPSRLYILAKFIRRNRISFASAVILMLALIGGFVTTAALYEREKELAAEQLRLKNEAQAARNEESRLRQKADARSNIARAAFLLDQGRIDEADALRQRYPLSSIEPSLEAAAVFRSLGDWNASNGRRDHAIQCFRLLRQANRLDDPQKILHGDDLMAIGAATLLESDQEYERYRDETVGHYAPAQGVHHAEHLLKAVLLRPASPVILERLARDRETMGDPRAAPCPAWAWLSLGLYEFRRGNHQQALETCTAGLQSPDRKSSCESTLHALASLVHSAMGDPEKARQALAAADGLRKNCDGKDFERGKLVKTYWFDWAIAGLLIREAEGSLQSSF